MAIQYSLPTLMKKVMRNPDGSGRLQWTTKMPMQDAVVAFQDAVSKAYPPVDPEVATLDISGPAAGEDGPVLYVNRCEADWIGEHFVTGVAAALEEAGYSGRLREGPRYVGPTFRAPGVVMAAILELDWDAFLGAGPNYAGLPDGCWWVSPERTERVLGPWLEWTTGIADTCLFTMAGTVQMPGAIAIEAALAAVARPHARPNLNIICTDQDQRVVRTLDIHMQGFVTMQSWERDRPGTAHGTELANLVIPVAGDISNAFLRGATYTSRQSVLTTPTPPPGRGAWPSSPIQLSHLNEDYLYDAHGWQLVTGRHLAHLGDLDPTRWTVEPVAPGRYTITAHDRAPWLDADSRPFERGEPERPPTPPVAVLERARADFAGALLDDQVIHSHPFPPFTNHPAASRGTHGDRPPGHGE